MTIIHSVDQGLINLQLRKILGKDYKNYQKYLYHSERQIGGLLNASNLFEIQEKKIIFLSCSFLANQKEAVDAENLFAILKNNINAKIFLTVESEKLAKTKALDQLLGKVQLIDLPKISNYKMQTVFLEMLSNENYNLSYDQLSIMSSRMIPNALIMQNEINKLKLFNRSELSNELLNDLVFDYNNESIFKLLELVIKQKKIAVAKLYDHLVADQYSPQEILQILAPQLLKLIFVYKGLISKLTDGEIIKSLSLTNYLLKNMKQLCMHTSSIKLDNFLSGIMNIDIKIKKHAIEPVNSVRLFLIKGV